MSQVATPEDVLQFWFEPPAAGPANLMAKIQRWFRGGPAMDREVIDRFAPTVEAALAGALDGWADTPRGRLALVIVLDQFTRNLFRNDPRTYAGDERAQALALEAFDRALDTDLSHEERLFLSMPLLHSEDIAHQRRLGEIAREIQRTAPPELAQMCAMHVEQSDKYTGLIERFGRFPHRNGILGRPSTPEEQELLATWDQKGPPSGAPPPAAG